MLVYPFTFYAVNGITRILQSIRKTRVKWMRLTERVAKLTLILPFSFGLVLMTTATHASAVPLRDIDDTIKAMQWLDSQMDNGSALLSHAAFLNWARLHLDERHTLIRFKDDIEGAIDVALRHGCDDIYFVWWNENIGWYGLTVPDYFVSIFENGRISVFRYHSSTGEMNSENELGL